jgi:2-aminoadipate transaminase
MIRMIEVHCPAEIRFTRPEGGMFLWVTLPAGISSMELFDQAVRQNVVFVPGHPFYVDGGGDRTLRLNFSNTDPAMIEEGIRRLGEAMKQLISGSPSLAGIKP